MSCELRIYDKNFNWLGEIKTAESVQFRRDIYGGGGFEIHLNPAKRNVEHLVKRDNVVMLNGDPHKCGIIEDFRIKRDGNLCSATVYAFSPLKSLASRRIVVPPDDFQVPDSLGFDRANGNAETVLKHYVSRHLASPFDANRKIANLTVAPNKNRGVQCDWQARYSPLAEELRSIGEYADMGFEIYADLTNLRWVFDLIPGTDRTVTQSIVSPVTFKTEYQNLAGYKYAADAENLKTTGYAGGRGQNENREIFTAGAGVSGLNRREVFLECGGAADMTELEYYAWLKMTGFGEKISLEAAVLPGRIFVYERDFFLGDRVTLCVAELGITAPSKVSEVKEIFEPEGRDAVEITLGAIPQSPFRKFMAKNDVL